MTDLAPPYAHQDLSIDQQLALRTAAVNLGRDFAGVYGAETIERFLHTSYDQFASLSSVPNFLPLLAERFARQRLQALAKWKAAATTANPSCCSCAPTTPGAPRWPSASSPPSPATGPRPGPAVPNPAARSTPPPSRR
ncbi:three-helix bundle dimerization domain-containing protein [Couchioplanes caeruleus]|uniref:three-helix bundle dimerization domain-containing protein n=1 Tax=Couchioplanes caeruleus TaxID=56438 RepID=UPI0031F842FE